MMRTDQIAAAVMSGLLLTCTIADAEVGQKTALNTVTLESVGKILYLGNSITLHPPAPAIGWNNNWGMAASAEAKDYVHLLTAAIGSHAGTTPAIMVRNIADFERNYATYDVETQLADAFAFQPDLFVLAIGENVGSLDAAQFKAGVLRIINGVKAQNSQAIIVVRSCFWADAAKDLALSQVAQQAGALFVSIGALGADPSNMANAETAYPPEALAIIGTHPGDKGMAAISSALFQALVALENGGGTPPEASATGDLPEALQDSAGLAFWVDANRNVAADESGNVTTWLDAREASGGSLYPRARQFGSELVPTLVTGVDDVAGNKLVDFGAFSCGKWLQWQDAAGNRYAPGNIRTIFLVISCVNGAGFLLGDSDGYGPGGNFFFHAGGPTTNGMETLWWMDNPATDHNGPVKYGLTRINGTMIDGMRQLIPHVGAVMSLQTAWNVEASNFCNDRNLKDGVWGVTPGRLGGGRIGEALIYTSELSEDQRRQVEDYLMRKWLGKTLEPIHVAAGETLSMTTTNALDLATVTGAGTVEVTGEGRITLPDTVNIAVPPIALGAGASASGALCLKPGQPFVLQGGASYEAASGVCTRSALADGTVATKTGSGVLTAAAVAPGVARINVTEGTLRLAPPLAGAPDVLTDALQNGSFEETTGSGLLYLPNQTYGGWTFTWGTHTDPSDNCGLAQYGSPFCPRQPPDGEWVMFLCNECSVSRTFTVSAAGRYEISFNTAAAGNAGWPWHLYQVLVDGSVVGSIRTSESVFQNVICRTPSLTPGAHTLTFQGVAEANRVSIIDNIKIRPSIEADEVEVPNSGFETPTVLTESSSSERPYAYFQHEPAGASWTFAGTLAGTTEGYSTFRCIGTEEGGHAAVLNMYNGGSMSVPLTFPAAGVYRITFKAAVRTGRINAYSNLWATGGAQNDITFSLSLNGVEAALPTQASWMGDFIAYEFTLPPVAADALTQTLAFQVMPNGWFNTILIDDVRVFRMPPIANPGFEDVSEAGLAWTLSDGDGVVTGITTPGNYYWNGAIPEGARCLVMANNGSASQSVTFETDGTYELSLLASQSYRTAPGHEFAVLFDGMQVGSIRSESTTFQRYAFRLPYVKAGQPHALVIQGLTPGGTWYASLIDSVILRKIVPEPTPLDGKLLDKATLDLATGATLELDYPGIIELDAFSYGGVPRTGLLSAATTSFVHGEGTLWVKPKGTVLLLQ